MNKNALRTVTFAFVLGITALFQFRVRAAVLTIDFGSTDTDLPYAQDGLVFTAVSGLGAIRGTPDDMLVTGGTFSPQIRVRGSSTTPFDLLRLRIVQTNQEWRVETSAGGVVPIQTTGTLAVANIAGFSGITSFDLVNDGGVVNAQLYIDDIAIQIPSDTLPKLQASPSPAGLTLRWPSSATNFVLESTATLSPPANWQAVTNTTDSAGGMFSVTLPAELPLHFFRLRKPIN